MKPLQTIKKSQHYKKGELLICLVLLQLSSHAQSGSKIESSNPVFTEFVKILPYVNGLVTILVFIAGVRGIQKILRSDPEGKTDLLYAGLGAAAYVGLIAAVQMLN